MAPFTRLGCLGRAQGAAPLLAAALCFAGCGAARAPDGRADRAGDRHNIVLVLTDDLSTDMLHFMPNTQALMREGASFERFVVVELAVLPEPRVDPHRPAAAQHERLHQLAAARRHQGLQQERQRGPHVRRRPARPRLPDGAVRQVPQRLRRRQRQGAAGLDGLGGDRTRLPGLRLHAQRRRRAVPVRRGARGLHDRRPRARWARDFIDEAAHGHAPVLPQAVDLHAAPAGDRRPRATSASCPTLAARARPAFNRRVAERAAAGSRTRALQRREATQLIDARYRKRVRSVVSIDEMVGRAARRGSQSAGLADETRLRVQLRQRLPHGRAPLLPGKVHRLRRRHPRAADRARGRACRAGAKVDALAQNTDLAPTFAELAGLGAAPDLDGRSLVGLLRGDAVPADWRPAAAGRAPRPTGEREGQRTPTTQSRGAATRPATSRCALADGTYVEYATGEREFYDLRRRPLPAAQRLPRSCSATEQRDAAASRSTLQLTLRGRGAVRPATPPARRAARAAAAGLRRRARRR